MKNSDAMGNDETKFQDLLMSVLDEIHKSKAGKVAPDHVTMNELTSSVIEKTKKALNELYLQGKIRVGDTLNGKYIVSHRWENNR